MGDKSGIQWTDATWNPVTGCSKVSAGCKFCYAEKLWPRVYRDRPFTDVRLHPERLDQPLRWRKPRMVFVNSMSDLFHEDLSNEQIAAVFGVMAAAMCHTFQVLTKRPERMLDWFRWVSDFEPSRIARCWAYAMRLGAVKDFDIWPGGRQWPLPNVWLGVSVEDQKAADERIPILLQTPAAVRWVSAEPLLGPIDFDRIGNALFDRNKAIRDAMRGPAALNRDQAEYSIARTELDWVVGGGESGPKARPCNLEWIRSIVEQCRAADVPVFVKQVGSNPVGPRCFESAMRKGKGGDPGEWPEDLRVREWPAPNP